MIELRELKQRIEQNDLNTHFIIFKCDKVSEFIPHQYAIEFCKNNNSDIIHIDSKENIPHASLFDIEKNNNLNLYKIDTLDENLNVDQEEIASNFIWVICTKISAKYKKIYENNIVEIPKLQDWQIKDFIKSNCNWLSEIELNELFSYYKTDLFRLNNELDKLKLIGEDSYNKIKSQLYVDINNFDIFDITNAIIKRDKVFLSDIYKEIEYADIEPFGLIILLINNFRHVIDVQLAKNATAESVGVSGKQFWAIKNYSCWHYTKQELITIFNFLNSLDYKIKSGEIDTSLLIDYIICKIFSL